MKKLIIVIMALLLVPLVVAETSTLVNMPGLTDLRIVIQKYSPSPVQPGTYFDLWLEVQGVGIGLKEDVLEDLKITLDESYPFSLDAATKATQTIGKLGSNERVTLKYKVRVADTAVYGSNEMRFKVMAFGLKQSITSQPVHIDVKSVDVTLSIQNISTDPASLLPGSKAKVYVVLKNNADTAVREIKAKLDLGSVPFAPVSATSEKDIRILKRGATSKFIYDIITLADATAKVYKVPLILTYRDSSGTQYTKNHTIGFIVDAKPDYKVSLEQSDVLTEGKTGKVVVSISNTGPSDLKFLTLKLLDDKAYEVISKNQEYLGNLESDDFETSEFKIYVKPNGGKAKLKVELDYKDAYNQRHTEQKTLDLKVYTQRKALAYGVGGKKNMFVQILIYAVLLLLVFRIYSSWKKFRNLEQAVKQGVKSLLITFFRMIFWFRWRNVKRVPKKIALFFKEV